MNDVKWYGRKYNLKFYDKLGSLLLEIFQDERNDYQGLRVEFSIRQQMYIYNQIALIKIYNLDDSTKKIIMNSYSVVFVAGYQKNSGVVYEGEMITMLDVRQQPDYPFTIYSLDYERVYSPIASKNSITTIISSDSTAEDAINQVASFVPGLTVQSINLINLSTSPINKRINIEGLNYLSAFEKVGLILGLNIWVSNGTVYAIPKNLKNITNPVPEITINFKDGMIGSPVFDVANGGVNVSSFLNHLLLPGSNIKIETLNPEVQLGDANYINFDQDKISRGIWMILTTNHNGDSWGNTWQSDMQCYSLTPLGNNVL